MDLSEILADALPVTLPADRLLELTTLVYEELTTRVGERIYTSMPEDAAFAFSEATDAGEEELAQHILEVECPHYKVIVGEVLRELVAEVAGRFPRNDEE